MFRRNRLFTAKPQQQSGMVLAVVIVLLLLASVVSFFALTVGTFEQRTSGNDMRSKMVQQIADSALAQAVETIEADRTLLDLPGSWELCAGGDTTFPCGSVPATRRATMWRFAGGVLDVMGDGMDDMDTRMMPMENLVTTVSGGFEVKYGVGAVLCRLVQANLDVAATCSADPAEDTLLNAVTLVSVAAIPTEGSRATAMKTISTYPALGVNANVPPFLASGTIDLSGGGQVVTNPNSGGPGVPVSIWTRKDVQKSGTPNSCYADEFFRLGAKNNEPPELYPVGDPPEDQTLTCDTCGCPGDSSLSFSDSGGTNQEGIDVLDVDGNVDGYVGTDKGDNRDVLPAEFPCDLFKQIFSKDAWSDGNADNFCETKIMEDDPDNTGQQIGADEAWLLENANFFIPIGSPPYAGFDTRFDGDSKVIACSDLDEDTTGIVWDRTGACGPGNGETYGSPSKPVIMVMDGGTVSINGGRVFGITFLRTTSAGPLDPATGGTAVLRMNAGSAFYGSVVVQGVVDHFNGTAAVIYDSKVLTSIINDPQYNKLVGLPGSWTDSIRY